MTQLVHLHGPSQLVALHDVAFSGDPPGDFRSAVVALDLPTLQPLAPPAADILDGYQLAGMAVAEQQGPVILAGSVRLAGELSPAGGGRRPGSLPAPLSLQRLATPV